MLTPLRGVTKPKTWGQIKTPITTKKQLHWGCSAAQTKSGIASRLRSSIPKTGVDVTLNTPEVTDAATSKKLAARQSLRVQVQGAPTSTMNRVLKRIRDKEVGSNSADAGIPLITNFPYLRLTVAQISELFQVYQIRLGSSHSDQLKIIEAIQLMDRDKFEVVIKHLLAEAKTQNAPFRLTSEILDSTALLVTKGAHQFL